MFIHSIQSQGWLVGTIIIPVPRWKNRGTDRFTKVKWYSREPKPVSAQPQHQRRPPTWEIPGRGKLTTLSFKLDHTNPPPSHGLREWRREGVGGRRGRKQEGKKLHVCSHQEFQHMCTLNSGGRKWWQLTYLLKVPPKACKIGQFLEWGMMTLWHGRFSLTSCS